jgi:hypothetical protein
VLRKILFFLYLALAGYAGFRLYAYSWDFDGPNTATLITVFTLWLTALPWSLPLVLFEGKSIGMVNWLLVIWSCIALNLAALAWLGWRKPKAAI